MVVWRISNHFDLRGVGGLVAGGRWHRAGNPVVYLGESPSGVLLEMCVHTASNDVPPSYTLLRIEGPNMEVPEVPLTSLASNWTDQPQLTQALGTAWLTANSGVLLRVPSAIVPHTSNYLFNPAHPSASEFHIVETIESPFDGRIKR